MSEEVEVTNDPERIVREVTFAVEGDGRTIEARIVPYNQDAKVVDLPQHGGTGIPYLERWMPGVFSKMKKAANRVFLNFEHEQGLRGVVGHGVALREAPDALYGTFRVHPGVDGDKALHMVNEGILTGLSVEAIPTESRRTADGVVERVKATLDNVALCRSNRAAYPGAEVMAVREQPPEEPEPSPEPPPEDAERTSEVDEILMRVGFEPIARRAISKRPWDGSSSKYEDAAAYCSACLIDKNPADEEKTVARCMLPVFEPNGDLNATALSAAAGRLNQVGASPAEKADAARKLVRLYRTANLDAPPALRQMAAR